MVRPEVRKTSPSRRQLAADSALALVFTALALVLLVVPNDDGYTAGSLPLSIALALLTTLPLAVRRVWPAGVALVVFGSHILPNLFVAYSSTFWGTAVPMAVVMYGVGRWCGARRAWPLLLLPVLTFTTYGIHVPEFRQASDVLFPIILFTAAWGAGWVIQRLTRQRHELDEALSQLAEQADAQRRRIVLEERTRIAREMHDVVAHGVSVMVVQAGSARLELDGDLAAARASLLAVEGTGREVLGELRRIVGLLRARDDEDASAEPSPGLAELPGLADSMRAAGMSVDLRVEPGISADPGRQLTVYRIVQESLTNALHHAGHTRVDVRVTSEPLKVEVIDDGPQDDYEPAVWGGGNGFVGLRERVAMYGGELDAGPHGAGFAVRAAIPSELRS